MNRQELLQRIRSVELYVRLYEPRNHELIELLQALAKRVQ